MKEQDRRAHLRAVAKYYNVAESLFSAFWHKGSYGLRYGIWADGVKKLPQAITYEDEFLTNLAHIKQGEVVLDAGCGIGASALWLAKNVGAQVVGINLVDRQLRACHNLVKKSGPDVVDKASFAKADFHQLPLGDSAIDVVWSLDSIHYAASVEDFVTESWRVLRPAGRLVIAGILVGGKAPSEEQQRQIEAVTIAGRPFGDWKTAEQVKTIMERAGFVDTHLLDLTDKIMPSANQMAKMSKRGYPAARVLSWLKIISPIMAKWGLYQEDLFKSSIIEYNVLVGVKPTTTALENFIST